MTFSGPTEKLCFSVLGGLAGTFSFPTELALDKVFSVPKGLSVVQKEHHFIVSDSLAVDLISRNSICRH